MPYHFDYFLCRNSDVDAVLLTLRHKEAAVNRKEVHLVSVIVSGGSLDVTTVNAFKLNILCVTTVLCSVLHNRTEI